MSSSDFTQLNYGIKQAIQVIPELVLSLGIPTLEQLNSGIAQITTLLRTSTTQYPTQNHILHSILHHKLATNYTSDQ